MDLNEYITNAEDLLVMERAVKACIMQAGAIADIFNEDIWNPNFTLKREEFRCYPVLSAGILALRRAGRDDLLPSLIGWLDMNNRRFSVVGLWDAETIC